MDKPKMSWSYLLKHWAATLILAPAVIIGFEIATKKLNDSVEQSLILYPLFIIYGVILSLPTLLGYTIILSVTKGLKLAIKKTLLISWTVIGIITTLTIIGGTFSKIIMISYGLTTIAAGIILRLPRLKPGSDTTEARI